MSNRDVSRNAWNKTDFKDTKDEDFSFEKNGIHYLFEFKGLTKDLKNPIFLS